VTVPEQSGEPDRSPTGGLPAPTPTRGRHRREAPGRGRLLLAAALAAVAIGSVVTGVELLGRDPEVRATDAGDVPSAPSATPTPGPPAPTTAATTRASSTPAPRPRPTTPTPAVAPPAPPTAFALPAQGVRATIVATGVRSDGELEIPEAPRTVGWWVGSAPAGSPRDTTLLVGHIDSAREGVGAFAALRDVALGAGVQLTDTFGGTHVYRVVARRTYPKYGLPDDVFRVRGTGRLVLVTCGGPFDERAGRYRDNVVVYAVPAG
jgi:hypothetical protein